MSSHICCCDTLLFNSCFDGGGRQIATCKDSKNSTVAFCYEGANETGSALECFITSCPVAKVDSLIPQVALYIVGGLLILAATAIFVINIFELKNEQKRIEDENMTDRKRVRKLIREYIRDFRASNKSFWMRTASTLGIEVLVLGGISGNYYATVFALALLQLFEFFLMTWKTYKMLNSNWREKGCLSVLLKCVNKLKGKDTEKKNDISMRRSDSNLAGNICRFLPCCAGIADEDDENQANDEDFRSSGGIDDANTRGDEEKGRDVKDKSFKVEPIDIYDDITTPISRVGLLFVCQITLLVLYLTAIYTAGSADFTKGDTYAFFIVGVLVQISYQEMKDKQPSTYFTEKRKYWKKVMAARFEKKNNNGTVKKYVECEDENNQIRHVPDLSLKLRIVMSNLVNCQGTSMLMYLLPLHLSHSSGAIDFVLNATAAYIIVELDDAIETGAIKITKSTYAPEKKSEAGENASVTSRTIENSSSLGQDGVRQRH